MSKIGRVYKIFCPRGNEVYVGSTFDTLRSRFYSHKNQYRCDKSTKSASKYLFDKYGIDNCKIVLVKEYLVCDKFHLRAYETLWMDRFNNVNKYYPVKFLLSKHLEKQYYLDHKEEANEKAKRYREENKETLLEKRKVYYCENRETIRAKAKEYHLQNAERMKVKSRLYYQENKESVLEKSRSYKQKNKEKIRNHYSDQILCEICQVSITRQHLKRHQSTKKHQSNLLHQNEK